MNADNEKLNTYLAIDIKSFYASVECKERGLDPLDTYLVVADESRTDKTICLAATPAIKSFGISGRSRLYEVRQRMSEVNMSRLFSLPGKRFNASSYLQSEISNHPDYSIDYIVAPPRMGFYLQYSTLIYEIYKKYVSPEDIIVYSIDEVFIDISKYLNSYHMTATELARTIIKDIYDSTGMTVTAGIGSNLYLAKIAMDIEAKHCSADSFGVRIAELDEAGYRHKLWSHRPLSDFWRVGRGISSKLEQRGIFTMGDIARCSIENEQLLYKLFGKNAELLIDHAWGWEPCTISDIKNYRPSSNSFSSGQVLKEPYSFEKARIVISEMADGMAYHLLKKGLATNQLVITINYDRENVNANCKNNSFDGETAQDYYGRTVPKHALGTTNLDAFTNLSSILVEAAVNLFDRITNHSLTVRRLNISANNLVSENMISAVSEDSYCQLSMFSGENDDCTDDSKASATRNSDRERRRQQAILEIREKYGSNSILKGTNFREGATARERNSQIGGHKA